VSQFGTDVDDGPAVALVHMECRCAHHGEVADQVHLYMLGEILDRHVLEQLRNDHPRGVDHNAEPSNSVDCLRHHAFRRRTVP
jgi:flavin reductase (DIM6/NTAB) family NADH-FMN oxidoreductase RutF